MPEHQTEYYFEGFKEPARFETPLTTAGEVALSQKLGGARLLRVVKPKLPEVPDSLLRTAASTTSQRALEEIERGLGKAEPLLSGRPFRSASELATGGLAKVLGGGPAAPSWMQESGKAIAPWVVPQTEAEALGMVAAGPAGRIGAKVLSKTPRLGALLGLTASGAGTGAVGAKIAGEDVGPEAAGGAARGVAGGALRSLPGIWRRQFGPTRRISEPYAEEITGTVGKIAPSLQVPTRTGEPKTPAGGALYDLVMGPRGRARLSDTFRQAEDALANSIPATTLIQFPALATKTQSAFTPTEVVQQLRRLRLKADRPNAPEEVWARYRQALREIPKIFKAAGAPQQAIDEFVQARQTYREGTVLLDFLQKQIHFEQRSPVPGTMMRRLGEKAGKRTWQQRLEQRLTPEHWKEFRTALLQGGLPGQADVSGSGLISKIHAVLGLKQAPAGYLSTGGTTPITSRFAGRLPLEASPLWKDLMAVLTQKRLPRGEEEALAVSGSEPIRGR